MRSFILLGALVGLIGCAAQPMSELSQIRVTQTPHMTDVEQMRNFGEHAVEQLTRDTCDTEGLQLLLDALHLAIHNRDGTVSNPYEQGACLLLQLAHTNLRMRLSLIDCPITDGQITDLLTTSNVLMLRCQPLRIGTVRPERASVP